MNDPSTAELIAKQPFCIFCGGTKQAVSGEHCPPRALFKGRLWPEGLLFSACEQCNGGSSEGDLVAAFMGNIDPGAEDASAQSIGLIKAVSRQQPAIALSTIYTATEARQAARRMGIRPANGQLYQDLPFIRVGPEMHAAVGSLAAKLTKALFYMQTGKIFPSVGGILMHWFTNEQLYMRGKVAALESLQDVPGVVLPLIRNKQDLSDQLSIVVSIAEGAEVIIVRATFRRSFGFVTYGVARPGEAERTLEHMKAESQSHEGHFSLL